MIISPIYKRLAGRRCGVVSGRRARIHGEKGIRGGYAAGNHKCHQARYHVLGPARSDECTDRPPLMVDEALEHTVPSPSCARVAPCTRPVLTYTTR